MTYIPNTNHLQGYKLTFADWFIFRLIEELTYEIDEEKSFLSKLTMALQQAAKNPLQ
jgi:hypothetical protein